MICNVGDDGSGTIEYPEFLTMMTLNIFSRDPKEELIEAFKFEPKQEENAKMICNADGDGSGIIECPELLNMMAFNTNHRDPKEETLEALKLFDDDKTNNICFGDLRRVTKELGERMADAGDDWPRK
eukprot:NODE_18364_length_896_cov_5.210663.p1 GENE.NODE_18364_length_896_cov_5.210663~~NODE_18364_length_896_cov_5.210663.p1  ORF type:complete len:127 (-),score=48.70 NODE_18364_length_896_cov_5.210663:392-772(-)